MQKKSEDFSMQEAMRLAQSPTGQELLRLLQQANGAAVQQAVDAANSGDYAAAARTMQTLLTPEVKQLLEKLGG